MEKIRDNVKAFRAYLNTMDEIYCDFFVDGNYIRCFFYQDYINEPTEKVLTKSEFDYMKKYSNVESYTQHRSLHSYAEAMIKQHNVVIERLSKVE